MELGMLVGFMGTLVVAFAVLLAVAAVRHGSGPVSAWLISTEERQEMVGVWRRAAPVRLCASSGGGHTSFYSGSRHYRKTLPPGGPGLDRRPTRFP
jgi:hypothetical protein